jgi:hypothetical protein
VMIGSVGPECENEQCADGSKNGARPGGKLALAVHILPPFYRLDAAIEDW